MNTKVQIVVLAMFLTLGTAKIAAADPSHNPATLDEAKKQYRVALDQAKDAMTQSLSEKHKNLERIEDTFDKSVYGASLQFSLDLMEIAAAAAPGQRRLSHDDEAVMIHFADRAMKEAAEQGRTISKKRLARAALPAMRPTDPKNLALFESKPVASYERFCRDFLDQLSKLTSENGNIRSKVSWEASNDRIDLKKTDSLITPYAGVLEFDLTRKYIGQKSGKELKSLSHWRLTLVAQGDRWLIKHAEERLDKESPWKEAEDFESIDCFVKAFPLVTNP